MFAILLLAISSQNVLPIHIAFIPIIIPPLLGLFSQLKIDRRRIAIIMTFGLVTPYMFLPVGFGDIYLNQILLKNLKANGLDTAGASVIEAMAIPALGMVVGLLIGLYTYRKSGRMRFATSLQTIMKFRSSRKRSLSFKWSRRHCDLDRTTTDRINDSRCDDGVDSLLVASSCSLQ